MFGVKRRFRVRFQTHPLDVLRDADDLICRDGAGFMRDVVKISSNGLYYHVAKFYWIKHDPMVVETDPDCGGGRKLSWYDWYAGRDDTVDVFRPDAFNNFRFDRQGAVRWMLDNVVDKPYGWDSIKRFGLQNNWITGWWHQANPNEDDPPPADWVCSTAAAAADKYGGKVHPVHGLWVGDIQPTILARANINQYQLTIPSKVERVKLILAGANL